MNYFVISKNNKNIAILFHDYLNSNYFIKSKYESFRRSFNAVVFNGIYNFNKEHDSLTLSKCEVNSPLWSRLVLKKLCNKDSIWKIEKEGNVLTSTIEEISSKYLN